MRPGDADPEMATANIWHVVMCEELSGNTKKTALHLHAWDGTKLMTRCQKVSEVTAAWRTGTIGGT
jgi:hypothetical protein